ncbi:S8 family serine peptidase [Paenibacillus sp. N1-5-1-14]|uniref:S8 family peptidase n=1 Tax=Paenibacillus radicibacter TaxID=2972488 RepID=UPI0021592617|nr:S8 family serine peptidase [Paenibacillus radicibacter]MCR8645077.1 S8 family serine peptidase [Paenibacillus radicibacter]
MTKKWKCIWLVLVLALSQIALSYPLQAALITASDPLRGKQAYLDRIGIEAAWRAASSTSKPIVIAVVDTGIDLTHPDLMANLVPGKNLLNPKLPPQDDFGHGTNVAGVIGAVANNDIGIAGIARNVKLMPIKAVANDGFGDEKKLGEGIKYAVDHGAKIVVLSLGLNKQSAYLENIVKYAEERDVLLVAATGNEGAAIRYPAAYASVLAVGGIDVNNEVEPRSNYGSELDVVAPWSVFTTALEGRYEYKEGTSMAAPQVAGVAALVWSKYPQLKASQVRNIIEQTAQDVHTPGWDEHTGYGLLRADLALTRPYTSDAFEPNDTKETAKPLSVNKRIQASFSSEKDEDWFTVDSPYDGVITFKADWSDDAPIELTHEAVGGSSKTYKLKAKEPVRIGVRRGHNDFKLQMPAKKSNVEAPYTLETSFAIYTDPYEDNDQQYKAYVLPTRTGSLFGTFDHMNDQDWYKLVLTESGTLRISVSVDTARMDPVLLIQKKGEKSVVIDKKGDGVMETTQFLQVTPGEYYIRVSNIKDYTMPILGQYELTVEWNEQPIDPFEPNDKPFQATGVTSGALYRGVLDHAQDVDWYQYNVTTEGPVQFNVRDIAPSEHLDVSLYNGLLQEIETLSPSTGTGQVQTIRSLKPGTYFIRLSTSKWTERQTYCLSVYAAAGSAKVNNSLFSWRQHYGTRTIRFERDTAIARATEQLSGVTHPL